jgi:predicted Co/Zn/Cd cation transporter (cation efflux family)
MANEVFRVLPPQSFVIFSTALIIGLIVLMAYVWTIEEGNVRYVTVGITAIVLAICAYFFIVAPYQTSTIKLK